MFASAHSLVPSATRRRSVAKGFAGRREFWRWGVQRAGCGPPRAPAAGRRASRPPLLRAATPRRADWRGGPTPPGVPTGSARFERDPPAAIPPCGASALAAKRRRPIAGCVACCCGSRVRTPAGRGRPARRLRPAHALQELDRGQPAELGARLMHRRQRRIEDDRIFDVVEARPPRRRRGPKCRRASAR